MKSKLPYILMITIIGLLILCYCLWKPGPRSLHLREVSFSQLPGWTQTNAKKSLQAFQISCKAFLKQDTNKPVGSEFIAMQAKDWLPACRAALALTDVSKQNSRTFFQTWFTPVEFLEEKPIQGLFTGYYMPLLQGSLKKTKKYHVPLYGLPQNLITVSLCTFDPKLGSRTLVGRLQGNKLVPFYTRADINKGAIKTTAPVVVWVDNLIDRSFLEIQGSGIIALNDGGRMAVGYIGENGAPYTAIAKVLIDAGVMTRDNASMQHIRRYLEEHPEKTETVLNENKSFVFFNKLRTEDALGSQGVALTPGYSLAIDKKWIPLGAPIWLNTTRPDDTTEKEHPFKRLMVAQDTGGAIKGVVRGDVYWGAGDRATAIAGKMKNQGHYWLLLPKPVAKRIIMDTNH